MVFFHIDNSGFWLVKEYFNLVRRLAARREGRGQSDREDTHHTMILHPAFIRPHRRAIPAYFWNLVIFEGAGVLVV